MSKQRAFEEAFNILCGEKLGEGAYRDVYACALDDKLVVKVEHDEHRRFANVLEDEFWCQHNAYEPVKRWLAPCIKLSPDGRILLQRRTEPLPRGYEMPAKVPNFLTDLKRSNFGLYEGRLVCHDYAFNIPNPSLRLKRAHWDN